MIFIILQAVRHGSYLIIQDLMRHFGSSNKLVLHYLRTWKTKSEQSLASAYMLHLYKLYWLYILEGDLINSSGLELLEGGKICCH